MLARTQPFEKVERQNLRGPKKKTHASTPAAASMHRMIAKPVKLPEFRVMPEISVQKSETTTQPSAPSQCGMPQHLSGRLKTDGGGSSGFGRADMRGSIALAFAKRDGSGSGLPPGLNGAASGGAAGLHFLVDDAGAFFGLNDFGALLFGGGGPFTRGVGTLEAKGFASDPGRFDTLAGVEVFGCAQLGRSELEPAEALPQAAPPAGFAHEGNSMRRRGSRPSRRAPPTFDRTSSRSPRA